MNNCGLTSVFRSKTMRTTPGRKSPTRMRWMSGSSFSTFSGSERNTVSSVTSCKSTTSRSGARSTMDENFTSAALSNVTRVYSSAGQTRAATMRDAPAMPTGETIIASTAPAQRNSPRRLMPAAARRSPDGFRELGEGADWPDIWFLSNWLRATRQCVYFLEFPDKFPHPQAARTGRRDQAIPAGRWQPRQNIRPAPLPEIPPDL